MSDTQTTTATSAATPRLTYGGEIRERPRFAALRSLYRRKLALLAAIVVITVILVAIFAPVLTSYDPTEIDIINRLIENKLVVRRRRRTDRRVVMVSISTNGEELLQRMDEPVRLETVKMLSGMSRERLLDLIVLLQDVRDSLYINSPA